MQNSYTHEHTVLAPTSGKIGVVTVLFNSEAVLPDFFSSLDHQTDTNFHVFAIDNSSSDRSVGLVQQRGKSYSIIRNSDNLGVATANNQGIIEALASGCEYVLLLNNDVAFGPELFAQLKAGLLLHQASMTAPLMYYFDRPNVIWAAGGRFQPRYGYRCFHLGDGEQDRGQFSPDHQVDHAPTCCVLIHRDVFQRVGLMDERYFVYHDDTDFMLRCKLKGERLILLSQAKLWHKVSSLTGGSESNFSIRMGTRNRMYMTSKFFGRVAAFPYFIGLWCLYAIRAFFGQDSVEKYHLKRRSLLEGYRMTKNWLPSRSSSF